MNIVKKTGTINTTSLKGRKIEWIVIHYTAGTTSKAGSALDLAAYYLSGKAAASSDFIVDDTAVVQYNGDIANRYTWGVGGSKYTSMSTPEGGRYYGKCKNSSCINIEVCSNKTNKKSLLASDTDWYFTDAEIELTVRLTRQLMEQYGIDAEHVIMHHHVTGKVCPNPWTVTPDRLSGWQDFQRRISAVNDTASAAEKSSDKLYCVQVGAFADRSNADKMLAEVKKKYPQAFISVK